MRNIKIFVLFILFAGCSYKIPQNMPSFQQFSFEVIHKNQKNILFVSQKNLIYHFMYQNSIGIPIAKKTLENGHFKTDISLLVDKNINHFFIKVLYFIKSKSKKDKITLKNGDIYEIRKLSLS